MRIKSYNKDVFLYIVDDTGKQYINTEKAKLFEKLDDVPEGVEEFTATIKTVPASVSSLGSDASIRNIREMQQNQILKDSKDPEDRAKGIQSERDAEGKLMPQTEAAYRSVVNALVSWNFEDENGMVLAITEENLKLLEPPWIFDYLREVYMDLNEVDMRIRRD